MLEGVANESALLLKCFAGLSSELYVKCGERFGVFPECVGEDGEWFTFELGGFRSRTA